MEMNVRNDRKLVEIWLSNAEKSNPITRIDINGICDNTKSKTILLPFLNPEAKIFSKTRSIFWFITESEPQKKKSGKESRNMHCSKKWGGNNSLPLFLSAHLQSFFNFYRLYLYQYMKGELL